MNFKSCLMSGAVALIAGALAGYWLCNLQWEAKDARMNESQAQAKAGHFSDAAKTVNDNAKVYQSTSGRMKSRIAALKKEKELNDVQKTNPVPDCRPDADRLRILRDAATAANTTAGQ